METRMKKEYFSLAMNSLKKRQVRSWLTMLGVIIGIAAVVSLIGIGQGLRNFVTGQFNVLDTNVLTITAEGTGNGPPGAGVVNPLTENQLQAVRDVQGVKTAVGRLVRSDVAEFNGKVEPGFFVSTPGGQYRKDTYIISHYEVAEGRLLKDGETTSVVIGYSYKDADSPYGKPVTVGSKFTINGTTYNVVGILKKKGSFTIDSIILMNEDQMRNALGVPKDVYDDINAQVADGVLPKDVKLDVEKALRKERDVKVGEEDFTVQTSEGAVKSLNDILFAVQLFLSIIAGVSLVVGGIGIMNTMFTAVLERTSEIGVMKAIGAKNSDIFLLFSIESGLIGLVGGIIGVIIGTLLAYGLAFAASAALGQQIHASVTLWLVVGALLFSFIIGTIAGLVPAMRASRLRPVDALREGK
jgi:putative ABC transport system permease protein